MAHNTAVMTAVESLNYRVTVGDVAAQSGLELAVAQQGLNALAADTQAHLQVSDAGEIAYEFPKSFRAILRNKYWRLRLQETWERIWGVLFYLIRISFGILLILSILVIVAAIIILVIAAQSASQKDDDRGGGGGFGGGMVFLPRFWMGDLFWLFHYDPYYSRRSTTRRASRPNRQGRSDDEMNFLEAVFSFLFGDGDPNADLEERRWREVGAVIQNNGGAIAAEQAVPYLDDLGKGWAQEDEDYILPVLTRFNGVPEVSPKGEIIYHFPELQVTAKERGRISVPAYLKETPQKFSEAKLGQLSGAIALGIFNFLGAIVLGFMLQDQALVAEIGGFIGFVNAIYWLILAYGTGFLAIPAIRYFWVKRKNSRIEHRNEQRQERALALNAAGPELDEKIAFAQQFAAQTVVSADDLAYTTAKELTEQEYEQREKLDAEWQKRLDASDDVT
ncbi:hypothetical protein [Leptolyngbya iicbica]|uniref:Uncharacterized protein n=2 Tax=Cyanophyceae TaxID=3028117 RepID=A0A4Q7EFT0_9CYAN|nr:hypothetical protein [Leptolyngbya sp. LK]RZM81788.1 hypothetical protein DYY88_00445 [Leptolyngbya sp. LK]